MDSTGVTEALIKASCVPADPPLCPAPSRLGHGLGPSWKRLLLSTIVLRDLSMSHIPTLPLCGVSPSTPLWVILVFLSAHPLDVLF